MNERQQKIEAKECSSFDFRHGRSLPRNLLEIDIENGIVSRGLGLFRFDVRIVVTLVVIAIDFGREAVRQQQIGLLCAREIVMVELIWGTTTGCV